MKIYISGPMTGMKSHNRPAFNTAAKRLRKLGHKVISPAELDAKTKKQLSWNQCLRRDIRELVKCTDVALLPGWEDSKGAHLEVYISKKLDIPVHPLNHYLRR